MTSLLRRVGRLLPLLALLVFCLSCDGFFVSSNSIQTVTISPNAVLLQAGATPPDTYKALSSSALTAGGTTTNDTAVASWTSSNTSVVTVSAGVLIATATIGNQTATIVAKDGGVVSNTCTVLTYTGAPPSALALTIPSNITASSVGAGAIFQLMAFAAINGNTSFNISSNVSWTSSAVNIALVTTNGVVTVVGTGQFTITATANLGSVAPSSTVSVSQVFTVV